MSMLFAYNEHNDLVNIHIVQRGLACNCTCFQCGEPVIAKKGKQKQHHFAHASNKESCDIQPESVLHKYAKKVINDALQLNLPRNLPFGLENTDWVTFNRIHEEQMIMGIKPDLIGVIDNTNSPIFIEIAVTHFIDDNKLEILKKYNLNTIEIDLREMLDKKIHFPSRRAEEFILGATHNKHWIYPILETNKPTIQTMPTTIETCATENTIKYTKDSYKIFGIWITVRTFNDNNIAITSIYNPQIAEYLKELRNTYRGWYNGKYKSSNFRAQYAGHIKQILENLDEQ